ncbi:MAG: YggS family pyridoxal phosphate-dependent enzyme [bacterium]|nr:YggS family pyridoxal phosphate-dependent enzyme [bacterium]
MSSDHVAAYARVRERIASACSRSGRSVEEITVVGVTKGHPQGVLSKARALNLGDLGENKVQEAIVKYGNGVLVSIANARRLHLIGHLQSNKVKKAVELFDCLDTVDSEDLAETVARAAGQAGRRVRVLLQVNTSHEAQKSGIDPLRASWLAERVLRLENIDFFGLMTIGPLTDGEREIRQSFADLRDLRDRLERDFGGARLPVLSMGMSGDFEWAIEEGATEIRLGTILWGARTA